MYPLPSLFGPVPKVVETRVRSQTTLDDLPKNPRKVERQGYLSFESLHKIQGYRTW